MKPIKRGTVGLRSGIALSEISRLPLKVMSPPVEELCSKNKVLSGISTLVLVLPILIPPVAVLLDVAPLSVVVPPIDNPFIPAWKILLKVLAVILIPADAQLLLLMQIAVLFVSGTILT